VTTCIRPERQIYKFTPYCRGCEQSDKTSSNLSASRENAGSGGRR